MPLGNDFTSDSFRAFEVWLDLRGKEIEAMTHQQFWSLEQFVAAHILMHFYGKLVIPGESELDHKTEKLAEILVLFCNCSREDFVLY